MSTVVLVLFLAVVLAAMGAVGALMVAGARQIIDKIEIGESQRLDGAIPESGLVPSEASQIPLVPGRS
jgi:hypothetical protein